MSNDLEARALLFAKDVRLFCRKLKWDTINLQDIKQVVRSSGSIGANYIEANENPGIADLKMHIRISRREAKETIYWLKLLFVEELKDFEIERNKLIDEAEQLKRIFSAILIKIQ
jgi:four helix bundle protein